MSNDNKTLADVQPGGRVRLATVPYDRARDLMGDAYNAGTQGIGYSQQAMELHDAIFPVRRSPATCKEGLQVHPSPGGQGDARSFVIAAYRKDGKHSIADAMEDGSYFPPYVQRAVNAVEAALAARQPVGDLAEPIFQIKHHDDTEATWRDATEAAYEMQPTALRRIVYAAPPAQVAYTQPVGEPVSVECEGCEGGIRYDAKGCSCMTCGKRPKWYMAGRRIRVTERRKSWKHLGAPVPFEAECTWQMGDSIDYRLDGETTSRRLNNFHQHWEKVEVIR